MYRSREIFSPSSAEHNPHWKQNCCPVRSRRVEKAEMSSRDCLYACMPDVSIEIGIASKTSGAVYSRANRRRNSQIKMKPDEPEGKVTRDVFDVTSQSYRTIYVYTPDAGINICSSKMPPSRRRRFCALFSRDITSRTAILSLCSLLEAGTRTGVEIPFLKATILFLWKVNSTARGTE